MPSCGIKKYLQTLLNVPLRAQWSPIANTELERLHLYSNVHSKSIQKEKEKAKGSSGFLIFLKTSVCVNIHYTVYVHVLQPTVIISKKLFPPLNVIGQNAQWM